MRKDTRLTLAYSHSRAGEPGYEATSSSNLLYGDPVIESFKYYGCISQVAVECVRDIERCTSLHVVPVNPDDYERLVSVCNMCLQ